MIVKIKEIKTNKYNIDNFNLSNVLDTFDTFNTTSKLKIKSKNKILITHFRLFGIFNLKKDAIHKDIIIDNKQ